VDALSQRGGWRGCVFYGAYGGEVGRMAGFSRRERYSTPDTAPLGIYREITIQEEFDLEERETVLEEEKHEPAKRKGSHDHDQKEGDAVADLCFFLISSNQS